jgi:hypothetical protein
LLAAVELPKHRAFWLRRRIAPARLPFGKQAKGLDRA